MTAFNLLLVALGGAIGSGLRYAVTVLAAQWLGAGFPYGTLTVNVAGSLAIGIIAELAQRAALGVTPEVRLFIAVGILGGFTTFSSFALDNLVLARDGASLTALGYTLGSVILGILAAYAGTVLARLAVA